jgi:hypothetical protein
MIHSSSRIGGHRTTTLAKDGLVTTTEAEYQVKSRLLLDVVVRQCASIFELLSSENQTLLIRRNAFLVLNLGLDVVNGIRRLHVKGDGLARQGFDEDLHATTKAEHQVKSRLLLDVVVRQCASILQLLSGKDETLLIRGNTLLVLNLGLDIVNGIRRLHVKGDGLARQGFDEDLHATTKAEHQVKSRLLLDVVIGKRTAILKLLSSKDQALLIRRNAFLVLNLGLDVVNRVRRLNIERNGLSSEGFDENLKRGNKKTQNR